MVQAWRGKENFAFRSHCALAMSIEFTPQLFHASAMPRVRSCRVVEDSNTLLTCSFGFCMSVARLQQVLIASVSRSTNFLTPSLVYQLRHEQESRTNSATCSASGTTRST